MSILLARWSKYKLSFKHQNMARPDLNPVTSKAIHDRSAMFYSGTRMNANGDKIRLG